MTTHVPERKKKRKKEGGKNLKKEEERSWACELVPLFPRISLPLPSWLCHKLKRRNFLNVTRVLGRVSWALRPLPSLFSTIHLPCDWSLLLPRASDTGCQAIFHFRAFLELGEAEWNCSTEWEVKSDTLQKGTPQCSIPVEPTTPISGAVLIKHIALAVRPGVLSQSKWHSFHCFLFLFSSLKNHFYYNSSDDLFPVR